MARDIGQPQLAELFTQYLERQSTAHGEGLGFAEPLGDVQPYEAVPAQPVDPKLAWSDALAALRDYQLPTEGLSLVPDWPSLVATHEPETSVAFAAGNFPQLVRNLHLLMQADNLVAHRNASGRVQVVPSLFDWTEKASLEGNYGCLLMAIGALRLARQFERAGEFLARHKNTLPIEWKAAWDNETAALAWHRGDAEQALSMWMGQTECAPVVFNQGMANLFLGKPAAARPLLKHAVELISAESAWHHLGQFYLALAEMRA